ncbi:hypothetical protein D1007_44192 [Hordeum vulgare]|nr:hypothetical protein D1007_44192 [Hordeum vulgare]
MISSDTEVSPHKLHDEANFPGSWIPLDAVESDDVRVAAACLQELLIDEILTRLPVDTAVCFRAVCRAWNEALASDNFIAAHAARAASACHPEIIFFSPTVRGVATSFYACSIPVNGGAQPTVSVRQVLTAGDLAGEHLVLSRSKPWLTLTLFFDVRLSEYHLFKLSTGEHVSMLPCEQAEEITSAVPRLMQVKRFPLELSSTGCEQAEK